MFYDNYVRLCNAIGRSPSAVAEELGLKRAAVTRWKKGGNPTDATAQKIADYFQIPVEQLKTGVYSPKEKTPHREQMQRELEDAPEIYLHLLQGAKRMDLDEHDINILLGLAQALKEQSKGEREKKEMGKS